MTYTAHQRRLVRRRAYLAAYTAARREGRPTSLVDPQDAIDHLNDLLALGWSNRALQHMTRDQVHASTFSTITLGAHTRLQRSTAHAILALPYTLAPSDRVADECFIPNLGAKRRLRALMFGGWSHPLLIAETGVVTRDTVRGRSLQMPAGNWRAIDAAYRRLAMKQGPSAKTTTWAKKQGFVSAVAWEDIDDPDDRPTAGPDRAGSSRDDLDAVVVARILDGDWRLRATDAERRAVVAEWDGSHNELARRTGWKIERYIAREDVAS